MDYDAHLDPELAGVLAGMPMRKELDLSALDRIRAERRATYPRPRDDVVHVDQAVPHSHGPSQLPVRVHRPPDSPATHPCLYWIHGGGYVQGSFLADEDLMDHWVSSFDCVVVSPEYRLAPEHPYPAALEDCYEGLVWASRNAASLGIDPSNIVVGGASAGGGLAAALALLARDRGLGGITHQLLVYPMLDDRDERYQSSHIETPVWSRRSNRVCWTAYLGQEPGGDDVPAAAAAARATDLSGLPAAFVGIGALDIFRDECILYASRLLGADVPVELHLYPGAPHAFDRIAPTAAVSERFHRDVDDYLRRALQG